MQKGFLGVICTKGSASFECGDGGVEMGGGIGATAGAQGGGG